MSIRDHAWDTVEPWSFPGRVKEEEPGNGDPRLALALDSAGVGIWHWDLKRDRICLNSTARDILKLDDELCPQRLRNCLDRLVHPDDRETTRAELAKLAKGRADAMGDAFATS